MLSQQALLSYAFTNWKEKQQQKKARTLYKMYKMKDYFFKWLQYYILFFDKKSSGDEKGTIL